MVSGNFRAANGMGSLIGPVISSLTIAIGGYFLAFLFVGIGYLIIAPIIYFRL